jgi:hypothetical protein
MINNRITQWLSEKLFTRLLRHAEREPDFVIGPKEDPYMFRWWVIPRNRLFNIYLHCVRHDDDDRALHDHPWGSVSLLLQGEIGEVYRKGKTIHHRVIEPGCLVFRSATFAHRLELLSESPNAWTLFITGPVVREWGFLCPQGWRHWREFTTPGAKGEIGRGCGEGQA